MPEVGAPAILVDLIPWFWRLCSAAHIERIFRYVSDTQSIAAPSSEKISRDHSTEHKDGFDETVENLSN